MDLLDRMHVNLRRLWFGLACRLGIRNRGLQKLSHDVKTCEYEDVRIMWELLNKTDAELAALPPKKRKKHFWNIFMLAHRVPHLCSRF
ncbi:hypothetical protein ACHQM5_024982 [Ranunculus cassubicifolius]